MPKYIIILSSEEQLPDDEFKDICDKTLVISGLNKHFKITEAMNLEGLREDLWRRKEQTKEQINQTIEENYEELQNLFKI